MSIDWLSQARRGVLDFCILSLIETAPRYGYDIVTTLCQWPSLAITEGTLYPLLRRLEREKLIAAYWQESSAGPPRKYYRLTPEGTIAHENMSKAWAQLTHAITQLQHLQEEHAGGESE